MKKALIAAAGIIFVGGASHATPAPTPTLKPEANSIACSFENSSRERQELRLVPLVVASGGPLIDLREPGVSALIFLINREGLAQSSISKRKAGDNTELIYEFLEFNAAAPKRIMTVTISTDAQGNETFSGQYLNFPLQCEFRNDAIIKEIQQ